MDVNWAVTFAFLAGTVWGSFLVSWYVARQNDKLVRTALKMRRDKEMEDQTIGQ